MGIESTIIGNGQTVDVVNLIYINRALVLKANSFPLHSIAIQFYGPQIVLRCPPFPLNLLKRNAENVKKNNYHSSC